MSFQIYDKNARNVIYVKELRNFSPYANSETLILCAQKGFAMIYFNEQNTRLRWWHLLSGPSRVSWNFSEEF